MQYFIGAVVGIIIYTFLLCGIPLLIVLTAGCNCGHPSCKICERNRNRKEKKN